MVALSGAQVSAELLAEAREWVLDAWGDAPADVTAEEAFWTVERSYEGGWDAFAFASGVLVGGEVLS